MPTKTIWDKHGNRIGEDFIITDRDGRMHITHYDENNNRVGRSYETTDIWGKVFMVHEDADGKRLATSTLEQDWWGNYYVKTEQTQNVLSDVIKVLAMAAFSLVVGVLCFNIVGMASITIWPYLLMGLLGQIIGILPIELVFFVLGGIALSYFPYIGILLCRRWKKKINWKDFSLAVLRWAIIGPFAYRWLLRMKKEGKTEKYNPHRPYELPVWQCPTCKTGIFTSGRFCPNCGTAQPERPKPVTVLCPNCGKPLLPIPGKEKTGFCSECGRHYNIEQK